MKRNGLMRGERQETRRLYSLTAKSAKMIEAGAVRIFQFPSHCGTWEGQWHLITYAVPEDERESRDRLRRELGWMGFGMLTNALWVSPHDHRQEIEILADNLGICSNTEIFSARHDGFSSPHSIVERCWDLPAINARMEAATLFRQYHDLLAEKANTFFQPSTKTENN